jgi:hypothetical protein
MVKPDTEQFGVTEEQCDSIYAKRKKILNFIFGISSAAGIITGCIFGASIAKDFYETVLFVLFFGCFLGSLFGAIFTIISVKVLYTLLLYTFSPVYRNCRQYRSARLKAE